MGGDRGSFRGCAVVSCGVLRLELESLRRPGFLDADQILYCAPGLHEWPWELEQQLPRQLCRAAETSSSIIVVYGKKCFRDLHRPVRETDALIQETVPNAARVNAAHCVDMLASLKEREDLAGSEKVHWLTPGWLKHWDFIFKDRDAGLANEMFPAHDKAAVLDALGHFDELMANEPEKILRISDWMKLPIEAATVSLDRTKKLLGEQIAAQARNERTAKEDATGRTTSSR